jgi:Bacterial transglutaminase-like N-terminal region
MKRIRIIHKTEYLYHQPVAFGPHRVLLRPREGHDLITRSLLDVEPAAEVRWLRDIYGNSVAILSFAQPPQKLSIVSEVDVDLYDDDPIQWLIEPSARTREMWRTEQSCCIHC